MFDTDKIVKNRVSQRIAIVLPTLSGGGAERVMVTLANLFAARGYMVDLVVVMAKGPFLSNVSPTVRVVDFKKGRVISSLFPLMLYLRTARPDATLSVMTHTNIVAIMARWLSRSTTRLVISERSSITFDVSRDKKLLGRILYFLVPLLYRYNNAIVSVSHAAAADLVRYARLSSDAVAVIYNPFELDRIWSMAQEPVLHPWLAPGQPPVILAIGRLDEAKDFATLIHAFAKLRIKYASRLLILGEGELRANLEALITNCNLTDEHVLLPGFVNNPFSYMARCSMFVLSSKYEGLPGVLIEAMACGAPVISTDCCSGPHEILEGGRWGRLVPVNDAEALTTAMAEVFDTPHEQLPDVRLRASNFESERAVDAYLKVMRLFRN
jgi:glycosyltransferase involved in cell wall biosynthesis